MSDDFELRHEWLDSFVGFFEWVYDVELKEGDRARVELELKRGWSNTDDSEIVFFARVLRAQDQVNVSGTSDRAVMRAKARENLKAEFADTALTDKSRVLAALHNGLESAGPGCTGVAAPRRLSRPDPTRLVGRSESATARVASEREHHDRPRAPARAEPREMAPRSAAPVDVTPRRPDKMPIPPAPMLSGLDSERMAQTMAEHWERVHRIHIMNGETLEADRALRNHQNYMNMMMHISETNQRIADRIWR